MSECTVPSHQRQEQVAGEEGNRPSLHVHSYPHSAYVVPMSNYEVAELTWENGQLAMQGLAGILPAPVAKAAEPTFGTRAGDTLESIVHQAACYNNNTNDKTQKALIQEISSGKRAENTATNMQISSPALMKKRLRSSDSDQYCRRYSDFSNGRIRRIHEDHQFDEKRERASASATACPSASATLCRDRDATMMTWASFESPGSFKTKTTDEDSACHDASENGDDEIEIRAETIPSHSAKRSRAAIIHNLSERRRRDRINQKMKALQKMVPNASKTDKASMLDEVIEYLKQLKTQVHMMSIRNMPQIMMNPLAIQQLQMSLLARMGMGMGVTLGMGMPAGMLDLNAFAARSASHSLQSAGLIPTAPTFVPPHFVVPAPAAAIPACNPSHAKTPAEATTNSTSVPFSDPITIFLAQQSMNMEFYKRTAALYRQGNQATQATNDSSPADFLPRE